MNEKSLFDYYIKKTENNFKGWDFSYITDTDRMVDSPLDWSYISKVFKYIYEKDVNTMLDMGTGGGELLSKFIKIPPNTYATEGYEANLPIARKRLKSLGIEVVKVENDILNFKNNYFDLLINRHESYSVKEIKRVLKEKGIFITQQVGNQNCLEINQALGAKEDMDLGKWDLNVAKNDLIKSDFKIVKSFEQFPELRFYDIGALIYYLKAVPWQIKDFTINKFHSKLKEIHNLIQKENYFAVKEHRFFLIAQKSV